MMRPMEISFRKLYLPGIKRSELPIPTMMRPEMMLLDLRFPTLMRHSVESLPSLSIHRKKNEKLCSYHCCLKIVKQNVASR